MKKLVCLICGMEINEKNYNFNNLAFIQCNTKDDIKYCPFCGVGKEYLIGENEYSDNYFKNLKLDNNTLKILDHAMKLEVFNGDFYKKASVLAKDEKIKKMFQDLSRVEFLHARVHKNLGNFKELPKLKEIDYKKYKEDKVLLDLACKREKHAVEYYKKYGNEVSDDKIKNVFCALADVERIHIKLTN
ncbi:rubrerythrin [Clostridium acetireducens DSM 10703]|jgi:rubrerythrin|uniref:Rubrerythrin n=1 Tax=Clostridium acetireducens DSM 10703 TaxID=1121290 RepID=A0A1E8EXT9_9CLOT|nr:ferritin family protein [Clostridium acetireducens]OFI05594.1 rubrerythrin [Clostridium acetireducens DSM 10703]